MVLSRGQKAAVVILVAGATVGVTLALTQAAKVKPGTSSIEWSASPTSGLAPLTVTFSGTFFDPAGGRVPGVTLYFFVDNLLQGGSVVTDPSGNFSFDFVFNTAGSFNCKVSDSQT